MAIQYTWSFPAIEVNTADEAMQVLHWSVTALDTETNVTASSYGTISHAGSGDETTRYYDDLTGTVVEVWMATYGNKEGIEESLATQIAALNAPVTELRPLVDAGA